MFLLSACSPQGDLVGIHIPTTVTILKLDNIGLTSFRGCPAHITEIQASRNQLRDFEGISQVTRLDISRNLYTDLTGCPTSIVELRCSSNKIVSLQGLALCHALRSLGCSYTHITSFAGCPAQVRKIVAAFTFITSLYGCPSTLDILYASYGRLSTLEHCPIAHILDVSCNLLTDIDNIPLGVVELIISNNPLLCQPPVSLPTTLQVLRFSSCEQLHPDIWSVLPTSLVLIECSKNHYEEREDVIHNTKFGISVNKATVPIAEILY